MRTESRVFPNAPATEAGQQRWQQALAFGCLPDDGGVAQHRLAASPSAPVFDILP